MNFIRKLLGQSNQGSGRESATRRSSHVTPSREQTAVAPIRESPPSNVADSDSELDSSAASAPADELAQAPLFEFEDRDIAESSLSQAEADAEAAPPTQQAPERERSPAPVPAKRERPSAPKPILTRQRHALTYGIASDVGISRSNNEDACFGMQWHSITVDNRPDFGFFAIADGMGGHLDGEKAAGIAVQTLASEMLDKIYVPLLRNFSAGDSPTIMEALVKASEKANLAVIKRVPGGGTTLSAVAIVGNLAYLVHVGDSRAYLLHDDKIEQLTTDHTLVQRLLDMKELTPEEADNYPQKNVLYRAIGQNEKLRMERLVRALPPAAHLLICTDGLWDPVDDSALMRVTMEAESPQDACDNLVKLANDRGGGDNVSVIVLKVPSNDA